MNDTGSSAMEHDYLLRRTLQGHPTTRFHGEQRVSYLRENGQDKFQRWEGSKEALRLAMVKQAIKSETKRIDGQIARLQASRKGLQVVDGQADELALGQTPGEWVDCTDAENFLIRGNDD